MPFLKVDFIKFVYGTSLIVFFVIIYSLQGDRNQPSLAAAPHSTSFFFQSIYREFAESISDTTRHYLNILGVKEELREAQVDNQKLRAELQVFKEVQAENERLKTLLEHKNDHPSFQLIVAKVSARDLLSDHFALFINKGSDDGIKKLSGVISPQGVVGYIADVHSNTSRILFLTDRLSSVDATVQRTRARGIISGKASGKTILKYIERPEDMQAGDLIITSSDQKIFPPGYPIGDITSVSTKASGVGHQAQVRPKVDLKKLEEVIILKAKK